MYFRISAFCISLLTKNLSIICNILVTTEKCVQNFDTNYKLHKCYVWADLVNVDPILLLEDMI